MRDRFVRIPFEIGGDDAPGDDFELHSYLFRVVCEQVSDEAELESTDKS